MVHQEQSVEIKILLFLSGFTILSLEILGIRILAPYVGTSAPVWAALISVPLLGSAVGYYGGGMLADRVQKKEILLWLAAGASLYIVLIPTLRSVMSIIALHTSYGIGAFIGSMLLFFVPVVFLSALVTYIIRVFVKNLDTVGQVHGTLYALTTVGSVVGVFGTSYILIPFFTTPHILYGLGILLILLSASIFLHPHLEKSSVHSKTSAD